MQDSYSAHGDKSGIAEFEIEGINYIAYEKIEADSIEYFICGDVQKEGRVYLKVSEPLEATHIRIKDNFFEVKRVDKNGTIMEIIGYSLADVLDFLID